MEHYRKAGSVELPVSSPMPQLPPDTLEMRVRDGSKIRNLLGLALGQLEGGSTRHVVFSGSGRAAGKAVSCAEIVKRRVPGLHQLTKLLFLQTEDSWVPASPNTGLDPLTVRRHVPAVWVLLSRDPLDPNEYGYQPPGAPPGLGSTPSSSYGPDPEEGLETPDPEDMLSQAVFQASVSGMAVPSSRILSSCSTSPTRLGSTEVALLSFLCRLKYDKGLL